MYLICVNAKGRENNFDHMSTGILTPQISLGEVRLNQRYQGYTTACFRERAAPAWMAKVPVLSHQIIDNHALLATIC
jgi:hypothetical protein